LQFEINILALVLNRQSLHRISSYQDGGRPIRWDRCFHFCGLQKVFLTQKMRRNYLYNCKLTCIN